MSEKQSSFQQANQTTVPHGYARRLKHLKNWQPLTGHAHSLELVYTQANNVWENAVELAERSFP